MMYLTGSFIPGTWREGEQMLNLQPVHRRAAQEAQQIRQEYNYNFVTEGPSSMAKKYVSTRIGNGCSKMLLISSSSISCS